jgi:hypothetical protein
MDKILYLQADIGNPMDMIFYGYRYTLGELFAECDSRQTIHRQRFLCRVLFVGVTWYSTKKICHHDAK